MVEESLGLIFERAKSYAFEFKWSIEVDLKTVMLKRNSGAKVLTWREADIAARKQLNLNNQFFIAGLVGAFLHEDNPYVKESIYILRATYNRGIEWVRNKRDLEPPEKQKTGNDYLRGIYDKIQLSGLKLWDEEKKNGFHQELLKPEYMTQNEFLIASRCNGYFLSDEQAAAIANSTAILAYKKSAVKQQNHLGQTTYQENQIKSKNVSASPKMIKLGSKTRRSSWKK